MWVVLRRIIECYSRKAFHLHAFITQKIMPRHFPRRKINFKPISQFIYLSQKYLKIGELSIDSKVHDSGHDSRGKLSLSHLSTDNQSSRRKWDSRVTDTRASSNFLCSPFPKHEWRRRENAYDRRDGWAISLCAFDAAAYLQQQQAAVARHWKIYDGFFPVASFSRSLVSPRCPRFRYITVTRALNVELPSNTWIRKIRWK